MPAATINGINLYYEDSGGDGPVITFLHGAGGNHISWWQQVPVFRDAYRCVTIDHRGFGQSIDTTGEGAKRFVDDLEALLDTLGIQRTALVAQSMGGRSALGFAVRSPQRVSALVMADTWGFFDWPEQRALQSSLGADSSIPVTRRALAPSYYNDQPTMAFLYAQVQALNPPRDAEAAAMYMGDFTTDQVRQLQVPTLCLVGTDDVICPPPVIKAFHSILPGAEYAEVPGAGHSVYFEDAASFNRIVGDFLARHGGTPLA